MIRVQLFVASLDKVRILCKKSSLGYLVEEDLSRDRIEINDLNARVKGV